MSQFGNSGPTRFLRAPPSLAPCTSYEATRDAYLPVLHGAYKQHVRTALWLSLPSQTPNPSGENARTNSISFHSKKRQFFYDSMYVHMYTYVQQKQQCQYTYTKQIRNSAIPDRHALSPKHHRLGLRPYNVRESHCTCTARPYQRTEQ